MGEYVLKEHVKDVLALYDCRDRDLIKAINEIPIANVQVVVMKPIEHGHWVSLTADCEWMKMLAEESVDAVPVVRCKDCEYSYEDLSGLCCSHGPCVDCNVPEDYFCAYGERRTENNGDQTNM